MTEARFVTDPIVHPIGQMELMPEGIAGMLDWVKSRAPACVPDELMSDDKSVTDLWFQGKSVLSPLFPHDMTDGAGRKLSHNELLIELAGRGCYNSYGLKAGRKDNATYITHTQEMDPPHACYDETTEVLTEDGWKLWPDVTKQDRFATRSSDGELQYHEPIALHGGHFSGKMYCVEGAAVDLLVTPNHKMLVCTTSDREGRKRERYELIEAQVLDGRSHCYIKDAEWKQGVEFPVAVMKLLGFAIGDGYIRDKNPGTLRFHLRKTRKISWLRGVCRDLSIELREEKWDGYSVLLDDKLRGLFDRIYADDGEKVIPEAVIRTANRLSLEALWEGLLQSDGHVSDTAILYSSRSLVLLDQIQQLLLHIGMAGHLHADPDQAAYPHITVCRKNIRPEVNRGAVLPRTRWIEWSGNVYCAEVPNHTLYVRRNGIPVWCGNSITYHAKMSFFIAGVSRRVSHELIRNYVGADRTEEGAPSQQSTRYVENPGYYVTPPRYLADDAISQRGYFERACTDNFNQYREQIRFELDEHERNHGSRPKGMDYKRILEAASGLLIHSVETSFIWTTNPAALAKLFKERDNEAADLEFQRFARKWKRLCMEHWPHAFPQPHMREGL